jgi:hypothetical protein
MLRVECEKCNGNGDILVEGKWIDCPSNCEFGYVNADENKKVYVNAYKVTRHFGGHEEGGWWYNWYECIEAVPCKNKFSDEIKEDLEKEYAGLKHGDIYSVLGGADVVVLIEETRCESQTKERPYYE